MGYRAFLIDLDGTLARAGLYVAPAVAEAVKRASRELQVSIVSSRSHNTVVEVARMLKLDSLQIADGGARIFDPRTRESLWVRTLDTADARRIISFLASRCLAFSAVDGDADVETPGDFGQWRVTRITATSLTPDQAEEIAERFGALDTVHTSKIIRVDNGEWMVDFTHATATKATAVARYAELSRIDVSQIIAAGDSFNDVPLLEARGLGVAMGNAVPEVKAVADYVAPPVDADGLAVAIDEFVLPAVRAERALSETAGTRLQQVRLPRGGTDERL